MHTRILTSKFVLCHRIALNFIIRDLLQSVSPETLRLAIDRNPMCALKVFVKLFNIYIYVCIYVCIYTYMYVCMYV